MEDTDFRDYVAACPDPLEGGPSPAGSRARPEETRAELDELEVDAMDALTRYVRRRGTSAVRGRYQELKESELKLRRRLRRRERHLESIRSSRWWRLRPRLPRRASPPILIRLGPPRRATNVGPMKAKVLIRPRQGILDPQGKAIERALPALGFDGVSHVRVGRLVELEGDDPDRLAELCEKLLANPLIEDSEIELDTEAGRV